MNIGDCMYGIVYMESLVSRYGTTPETNFNVCIGRHKSYISYFKLVMSVKQIHTHICTRITYMK